MKKNANITASISVLTVLLLVGLSCDRFTNQTKSPTNSKSGNYIIEDSPPTNGTAPDKKTSKIENADFTMTAEEYDKIFTRQGVKDTDLEKYKNKNIRVTGRISLMSLTKEGTVQPYVKLFAPGTFKGVSCSFDDENLEQMKPLKMDKVVTVQGFQGSLVVPEVSPMLDHCVVIKAD